TVTANWVQTSTQGPSPRVGPAMAYDLVDRKTVLFGGGGTSDTLGDTWQYDGTAWTQVPVSGPLGRTLASMVYDSTRGVAVLFGGYNNGIRSDTWEWNGSAWNQRLTTHIPPARLWHSMAYDPSLGGTVMFAGASDPNNPLNDTWLYDGADWQQITPNPNVNPRLQAAMSYDPNRAEIVVFGGAANIQYTPQYGDTLALRGVTTSPLGWARANPSPAPSARVFAQMDYDSARGVSVLFGGSSDSGP